MSILRAVRGCVLVLLCGVLLVLAVLLVLPDEAPSELSVHLHEKGRLDVGAPSEGFFYWMGLAAEQGEDPEALGRQRVEHYQQYLQSLQAGSLEYAEPEFMSMALVPLNGCSLASNACVTELLNDKPQLDGLIAQAALIFKRYQRLMALEGHRNPLEPGVEEPMPPFGHLKQGNLALRLQVLKSISIGQAEQGVAQLLIDISTLRKRLAEENTLPGKAVYARLAAADIALLMTLQGQGLLGELPELQAISSEEKSLIKPLAREYVLFEHVIAPLPEDPHLLSMDIAIPGMLRRLLFKKQRTLNQMADLTNAVLADEGAPNRARTEPAHAIEDWLDLLVNPLGSQLAELAAPDVERIQRALSDLEEQIEQFNQHQLQSINRVDAVTIFEGEIQ